MKYVEQIQLAITLIKRSNRDIHLENHSCYCDVWMVYTVVYSLHSQYGTISFSCYLSKCTQRLQSIQRNNCPYELSASLVDQLCRALLSRKFRLTLSNRTNREKHVGI